RLGSSELPKGQAWLFRIFLISLIVVTIPTLYLVSAISLVAISTLGYVSASGKVPWMPLAMAVLMASFLHAGKADMREQYWGDAAEESIQPWEYPVFFGQWVSSS